MSVLKRYNGTSWEKISLVTSVAASSVTNDSTVAGPTVSDALNTLNLNKASTDIVTTSANGLMSSIDKVKLDGIAEGATANVGTVTGITVKMNDSSKGTITTSGTIDLGTVITSHQDISGKENSSNKVTTISSSSTDIQYPSAKSVYDTIISSRVVPQFDLLWVNNTSPLDSFYNVSPNVPGRSFADYGVFLLFYKTLYNYYGHTDPDYQTQPLFKGVCSRIEMRGYEVMPQDVDEWRYCTVTNNGFTVERACNAKSGAYCDIYWCIPCRLFGLRYVNYDRWD